MKNPIVTPKAFTIGLGCLAGLACIAWGFYVWIVLPHHAIAERISGIHSLGLACKLYAADHGGKYPDRLSQLNPDYISDPKAFVFFAASAERVLALEYFGGTDTQPPHTVLIRIPPDNPKSRSVVVHSDMQITVEPP